MLMPVSNQVPAKRHTIRTLLASFFGTIAVSLVLTSLTIVWLDRTLTDTNTYVSTVAPLVQKPEIQHFLAQKVSDIILSQASPQDIARGLLPTSAVTASEPSSQLSLADSAAIQNTVLQIIQSPRFATLWVQTNRTTHASLVEQLSDPNIQKLTLDFTPAVGELIAELQATKLNPVVDAINLQPDAAKITIQNSNLPKVHQYFVLFQAATLAIVVVTILSVAAAVWLSIDHLKTLRRILVSVGVLSLLQAALLVVPSVVSVPYMDATTQNAAKVVTEVLTQNLLVASIILGVLCIAGAVVSKVLSQLHTMKKLST